MDASRQPILLFVFLHDIDLCRRYGDCIDLRTNGYDLIFKSRDIADQTSIKKALFDRILAWPELILARDKLPSFCS